MNPLQQRTEREHVAIGNDDLAVEHEVPGIERPYRFDRVGEIAR